jgi:hypothetical protein
MVPHTNCGAFTMTEAAPDNVLILNKIPDSGATGDAAADERIQAPLKDRSLLEQFLENLRTALSDWPV